MRIFFKIFVFVLLSGLLASCSIERKVAKEYIKNPKKGSILLFTPDFVFKKSLKEEEIKNPERYTEAELDSLLYYRSELIQYVDDSVFLERLINSYITNMKFMGFDIYTQEYIDLFMQQDTASYVVNLAQLELEEYTYVYEFEEMVGYEYYTVDIDLDAVNCNVWFEINKVNDKKKNKTKVLFTTHYINDDLYGQFRQNIISGDVKFEYEIDSLYIKDVYEFAEVLGKEYADYTFNYLLNKYINEQIIDPHYRPEYLQYDFRSKQFYRDAEEGFEVME